jgi:DNA-binding NarL/FixJ family response regulator
MRVTTADGDAASQAIPPVRAPGLLRSVATGGESIDDFRGDAAVQPPSHQTPLTTGYEVEDRFTALLYGRDAERSVISALLEAARRSRSGVLVVRGEPGVGKSALLEDARARAPEMQLLRCVGIESEAQLPFAALHQLLRPVLGHLERLPGPQAKALRAALGLGAAGGDDPFLISLAVLSLLAETAERRPLLCLIDDAHWLDDASADALAFVARRLEAEGVVLLFAAREGDARHFDAPGLPELRLGGLDADAAGALLAQRAGIALSQGARERLVERTGGHPLALLELPSALSETELLAGEPLLTPVPISARLERAFLSRLRALPDETQTLLLVAAADDKGEISTVLDAAAQLAVGPEALDAAEQAELVRVRGSQFGFHHPLVRSAVYQGAPLSQRQAAHRAIASVLEGEEEADRRAWHRAAASVAPDPSVVEELEQAAERARQRSGFAAASRAFERAAVLTPEELPRARRLTLAAENAWLAGRLERARMLLERARPLAPEAIERADIDRYLGLIEVASGVPANAYRLLYRAAADVAPLDGKRALQLLNLASIAALYAGDGDAAIAIAELARTLEVDETPLDCMLLQLLGGLGAHFEGDFARAAANLRSALAFEEKLREDALVEHPVAVLFAGRAALFLSDDERAYPLHQEAAARARAGGALSLLAQILPRLAHTELRVGRPASASANAAEGLRLARELGQHDLAAYGLVVQALIAAYRGAEDECRTLAAEARELAAAHGFAFVNALADWALAHLELGLGQADEALRRARDISTSAVAFFAALDRIEAAIRMGEFDTAHTWLAAFEPWAERGGAAWARAVALHAHALLSEDEEEAERLFQAALAVHAEGSRPFERARTELAYGEFLRRGRRRVDAREHLRTALDGFERLGATPWAERARVELRASGQTARKRDPSTRGDLTAQELQIAQFVAQGLSNREVGAQLFLSPRTVAFHLRNVFRKLGISSRTQLAHLDLDATSEADSRDRLARQGKPAVAA